MKLFSTLILASAALVSAVTSAGGSGGVARSDSAAEPVSWPADAAAFRLRRRAGASNSERLQRGLTPSRPRQLYQAKGARVIPYTHSPADQPVDSGLAKRLVGAPQQAQGSSAARIYNFEGCYSFLNGVFETSNSRSYFLTYTTLQDFADQCAAMQDRQAGTTASQKFILIDRTNNPNCYTAVTTVPANAGTCVPGDLTGSVYAPA